MKEITRSEFMKCCVTGLCSCTALAVVPEPAAAASGDPEAEWLREQVDAIRIRYAKLAAILDDKLEEPQKTEIFEGLGRECARQFRSITFDKYKGDIDGFLQSVQQQNGWVEEVEYDRSAGTIRIVDRAGKCTCPLVKTGMTPAVQCKCTLGWQKETYSAILGRPVKAEVEESILRGGKRCVFRIQLA
jgi:predicted hydrocarbon binding protein